jgi:hypothetical protein
MWLKEGIKLEGNFQKAQKIVMDYEDFCVKKKKQNLGKLNFYLKQYLFLCLNN